MDVDPGEAGSARPATWNDGEACPGGKEAGVCVQRPAPHKEAFEGRVTGQVSDVDTKPSPRQPVCQLPLEPKSGVRPNRQFDFPMPSSGTDLRANQDEG